MSGWKLVQSGTMNNSTGAWKIYYNGEGLCNLHVYGQAAIQGSGKETGLIEFNSKYAPIDSPIVRRVNSKSDAQIASIWGTSFKIFNSVNVGSVTVEFSETYHCNG